MFMPISMPVYKKLSATKMEDATPMTPAIQMEEILDQEMEVPELALLLSQFHFTYLMDLGLFNGPGSEELLP